MNVLVVDIGGTSVKILATGQTESRRLPSGVTMTPEQMVAAVKALAADWPYERVSIGYPGQVAHNVIVTEPHNLAPGWIGFDLAAAFGVPVRLLNDAAMQALGSYNGGIMLFLGLGTGLGSTLVAEGVVVPMELAHLSYLTGTYEDYLGIRGVERLGEDEWAEHVAFGVARLIDAFHPDDVVLGGGNAQRLKTLPPRCRAGNNANAFLGGFRMWNEARAAT
ncbi:MAG: ROK family protein [Pseudomonadota bacterium]